MAIIYTSKCKDRIKTVVKWLGGVIATTILSSYVLPIWQWFTSAIVQIGSALSSTYLDSIYIQVADIHTNYVSYTTVVYLSWVTMIILGIPLRNMLSWDKDKKFIHAMFIVPVVLFAYLMGLYATQTTAQRIQAATLSQLDIIKPYADNTEELYSQFLLVQGKDDYMKVWNEIYTIAVKNDVVLARFKEKGELLE
ncbi:hypothetical protein [Vibrio tasmaniensis]|uniref:hypothetical protein n=1 Tax=Vibrio tasmaniensis TaxID=212663 RepID=UPI00114D09DB|nr:hypothetical protein [Vibrio tasmaniensis]